MDSQTPSSIDPEGGPGEVGNLLRASRLRHGQELADVARALRIRTVYLQAIEDSRYQDLPGTVYAIGFIRSYAEHLGLDGEQLVERFKADASGRGASRKPLLSFPAMVPENGIPRGAIIALGGVILLAAYGAWYFLSTKDLYVADLIPPVPESIARAFEAGRAGVATVAENARDGVRNATRPDPSTAVAAARPTAETKPAEPVLVPAPMSTPPMPAPAAAVAPAPVPASPAADTAPPVPVANPMPNSAPAAAASDPHPADEEEAERTPPPTLAVAPTSRAGIESAAPSLKPDAPAAVGDAAPPALDDRGGVDAPASGSQLASLPGAATDPDRKIVLKAVVDSWIQIRDTTENKLVLTRLLRKGEQYDVPAREGLTLVTGNAGGLEVTVGGDETPSLGPIGVVRRNILLDPERLRAGTAIVE